MWELAYGSADAEYSAMCAGVLTTIAVAGWHALVAFFWMFIDLI